MWGVLAACSKSEDTSKSTPAPPPQATASATTTPTPTSATDMPKRPELSEDAVPKDEAIAGSMVVDNAADGYRYQIPVGFRPTADPISGPWTGKIKGVTAEATLDIFAARTKFKGDIDALVANETKDITSNGGKIELAGPVLVWIAGRSEPARARRLLGRFDDRLDYRVLVVRAPNAYVFHCQTQSQDWNNVGAECMARGTSFHVAPPPVH